MAVIIVLFFGTAILQCCKYCCCHIYSFIHSFMYLLNRLRKELEPLQSEDPNVRRDLFSTLISSINAAR